MPLSLFLTFAEIGLFPFVGHKQKGLPGAIAATVGMVSPCCATFPQHKTNRPVSVAILSPETGARWQGGCLFCPPEKEDPRPDRAGI